MFWALNGATATPRSASRRQSPAATVDLPTCEAVPATRIVRVISVFGARPGALAGVDWMFPLADFGDQIGVVVEVGWFSVAAGEDEFEIVGLGFDEVTNRIGRDELAVGRIQDFVENQHMDAVGGIAVEGERRIEIRIARGGDEIAGAVECGVGFGFVVGLAA